MRGWTGRARAGGGGRRRPIQRLEQNRGELLPGGGQNHGNRGKTNGGKKGDSLRPMVTEADDTYLLRKLLCSCVHRKIRYDQSTPANKRTGYPVKRTPCAWVSAA